MTLKTPVASDNVRWQTGTLPLLLFVYCKDTSKTTPYDPYNLKYVCTLITFIYTQQTKINTHICERIDLRNRVLTGFFQLIGVNQNRPYFINPIRYMHAFKPHYKRDYSSCSSEDGLKGDSRLWEGLRQRAYSARLGGTAMERFFSNALLPAFLHPEESDTLILTVKLAYKILTWRKNNRMEDIPLCLCIN